MWPLGCMHPRGAMNAVQHRTVDFKRYKAFVFFNLTAQSLKHEFVDDILFHKVRRLDPPAR